MSEVFTEEQLLTFPVYDCAVNDSDTTFACVLRNTFVRDLWASEDPSPDGRHTRTGSGVDRSSEGVGALGTQSRTGLLSAGPHVRSG